MSLFYKQRIGIDLGTTNTLIYIDNKGIALREPSIVAINTITKEAVAFGKEAEKLVGKTSQQYEIIRPLKEGVLANFSLGKQMLMYFIKKAIRRSLSGPEIVISVPDKITKVEKRAFIDAIKDMGIRRAMMIENSLAAALGANISIKEPRGKMIVDIGGGTTTVAIISYGEIIESHTIVYSGLQMNERIIDAVREYYQLVISLEAAEEIKIKIGNANYTHSDKVDRLSIRGLNVVNGLPEQKMVGAEMIAQAINEIILLIIQAIKKVLEATPPEIAVDILETGIVLTGGGALLKRLPERLEKELKLPVHLVSAPLDTVVVGTGKLFKEMELQSRIIEKQRR